MVLSAPHVVSVSPRAEKTAENTSPRWPRSVRTILPDSTSQIGTLAGPAPASHFPSGEKLTSRNPLVGLSRTCLSNPVSTSQTRTILSHPPPATFLPSGEKATE